MRLGTLPGQQGAQGRVPAEPELARGRPTCRIATDCEDPCGDGARAKSYGQVLREYRRHREDKFNSPDGQRCRFATQGLLQRRPVYLAGTTHAPDRQRSQQARRGASRPACRRPGRCYEVPRATNGRVIGGWCYPSSTGTAADL